MGVLKRVVWMGGLLSLGVVGSQLVVATNKPATTSTIQSSSPAANSWQRSWEVFNFQTTAPSGWQRGEEIYYFKCWLCHNEYAKTGPFLKDLYQRPSLASGEAVNDGTVSEIIRNGSPSMPAYRHTLTDSDLQDVLTYLRDRCCFDASEPPRNPRYRHPPAAPEMPPNAQQLFPTLGGARGQVTDPQGEPLEGIGVQLISPATAIRTTVYSNQEGYYEFPVLEAGAYQLRVPRPLEFHPYHRESVQIDGATELENIVLRQVSESEFLPPSPEILAQLTGSEWMMNLPGTGKEKRVFTLSCGFGCHSYQQIFRERYDEQSWRLIVHRMIFGSGSPLINMREPDPNRRGRSGLPALEEREIITKWLARVRGPESKDTPLHILPRERGRSNRVIITEYELPRTLLAPHDVHGDSQGRIWYTPHRSPYIGALDPRSGRVEEFRVPELPGALPGTHRVWVDERDIVYVSENWAHNLTRFDPRTETFQQFHFEEAGPLNSPGFSNFAMDPSGFIYETLERQVVRIDRDTGQIVRRWPLKKVASTYDNIASLDGRYWAGGPIGGKLVSVLDMQTGQLTDLETGRLVSSPARGGFDHKGIAWLGGRGGMLLRIDPKALRVTEYFPPFPDVAFYEMLPDTKGEVWGTALHSGRFLRFNQKREEWTAYMLPEPFSHNRRTWVDNSTHPVTVWYVDHNGYMVRIQPLE